MVISVKDEGSIYDPFSFRPPQDLAASFAELCDQLGYRKTQALSACLESILDMVDAAEPQVPRLVTMVRTLREQRATMRDAQRPFSGKEGKEGKRGEVVAMPDAGKVVPFPVVQAPPDHVLVPLYGSISAGYPGTGTALGNPSDYVPVPADRARGAKFALRVAGDSMNKSEEGIQDGDLVLLADAETRQPSSGDIVAALVDGETCLKRFCAKKRGGPYLQSESDNPAFGKIYPARELLIQGVFLGKL